MMYETIVRLFDTSQFNTWVFNNPVLFLCILTLGLSTGYFLFPRLMLIYLYLRHKRRLWSWQILRGKQMSKRARDQKLGERLYDFCLDEINSGRMTHKEKRRYLRNIEMAFELEPGTLIPKPSIHERKRRTLGRLSTEGASKFTEKVSAATQPLKQRLSSLIAGKV